MKRNFVFVLCLCIGYLALSQNMSKRQMLKKAQILFYEEDFKEVMRLYEQLEEEHPKEQTHYYWKYIVQHLTSHRGQDLSGLLAFEEEMGKTDKFYNYWLGRIHLYRYEFEEAREHLQAFLELDVYKSDIIIKDAKNMLNIARKAEPYYNNPDEFEIEQLPEGVNTKYSEISPAFFSGHEELIFASNRNPTGRVTPLDEYSIYHTIKKGDVWTEPSVIPLIGSFPHENAKIEIIDRDKRLYMFKPENGGDLFYSSFENEKWTVPVEFDANIRNKHIESHFFINDEENLVLFVSKQRKDKEIWQTRLVNGTWTDPTSFSSEINSPYDEESPFLSHDGKILYFSSNRPESIGGYDVFRSEYDPYTNKWGKPENMGFPINTIDNDINFEVTPSDQSGFLSSDRLRSFGSYDLFYFHKIDKIAVEGQVIDQATGRGVRNVEVRYHPVIYEDESFKASTGPDGYYIANIPNREKFNVEVVMQGTVIHTTTYESYIPIDQPNLKRDFKVEVPDHLIPRTNYASLYQGSREEEDVEIEMIGNKFRAGHKAVINNIYFDTESSNLKTESLPVLDRIYVTLVKYPDLRIEIAGHTDNVGPADVNMSLSKERANAVKTYLVKQGISSSRLVPKGYGETQPLASNDDEKDGRELNRRIEIIALDEL